MNRLMWRVKDDGHLAVALVLSRAKEQKIQVVSRLPAQAACHVRERDVTYTVGQWPPVASGRGYLLSPARKTYHSRLFTHTNKYVKRCI